MRQCDRLVLRELQGRIPDRLRNTPTDEAAGQSLWADLQASVEMFGMVNCRQELLQHDAMVLRDLLALDDDELSSRFVELLHSLASRDTELDKIPQAGTIPDRQRGRAMIKRVWQQLSRQGGF